MAGLTAKYKKIVYQYILKVDAIIIIYQKKY